MNFFVTTTFPQVQGLQQRFFELRFAFLCEIENFSLLAVIVSQSMKNRRNRTILLRRRVKFNINLGWGKCESIPKLDPANFGEWLVGWRFMQDGGAESSMEAMLNGPKA
ncbi:hypothetical protein [Glutamicibacter sp.]|uniref:hypothetical protein n=1 Tax=Glutamicibacter sp. TaxID=1931995 RepID=UPI003D6C0808